MLRLQRERARHILPERYHGLSCVLLYRLPGQPYNDAQLYRDSDMAEYIGVLHRRREGLFLGLVDGVNEEFLQHCKHYLSNGGKTVDRLELSDILAEDGKKTTGTEREPLRSA